MATLWYDTASSPTATWSGWLTTATTTTTAAIWHGWTDGGTTSGTGGAVTTTGRYIPSPETDAQRAAREARWEENRRQTEERVAKEKTATERAEALLLSHLSGRQRRQYQKDKSFTVRGRDGHRYRITHGWSGHVFRLNDRFKPVERFCIHPREQVPVPDNQLIAKLMLETEPDRFRRIANVTPLAA